MVTTETVRGLKDQLVTANRAGDAQTCIDVLIRLETEVESTNAFLKETQIGAVVNGVARGACSPDVANLAKTLVNKWKQAVGVKISNGARRASISTTPSLPTPVSPPSLNQNGSVAASTSLSPDVDTSTSSSSWSPPLLPIPRRKTSHDTTRTIVVTRISKKRAATTSPEPHEPPRKLTKVVAVRREPSGQASDGENTAVAPPAKKEPARSHRNDEVSFDKVFELLPNGELGEKGIAARTASLKALYDALACDSTASNDSILGKVIDIEQAAWDAFPPDEDDDEGMPAVAPSYRAKLRVLLTVKAARYLDYRERILSDELDVDTLIAMKPNDFITDEQKALDERARLASLQRDQISASDVAEDLREKARWRPG
ncbi:hypothetical protein JCM3775_004370 [Rhodotorula graminis]|uniref:TFIIS N-terminal domain-containing protein n=1 Tax=Rhodotorula graminis (strain WP1) TaxID=578459 RepID=A0A194SEM3_RHOGW|nr:uncharacterized protein RHOBADRAFT_40491 [Rhodotorula graminis WP1]KPV77946.1 hypothetical protein RHOBADRAFT_40491 [Rhodotorula graminis WP1]